MKRVLLIISLLVMFLLVGCRTENEHISEIRTQYPKNTKELDFKKPISTKDEFITSNKGLIYNDVAFYVCNYDKVPVLMLNLSNNLTIDLDISDSNCVYVNTEDNIIKVIYSANEELIKFSKTQEQPTNKTLELVETYNIDGRTIEIIKQENTYYALVLIGDETVSIEINEIEETKAIELLKELCGLLVL